MSVYVFQVRRFSECSRVRALMTANAGAGVGIVKCGSGICGTNERSS